MTVCLLQITSLPMTDQRDILPGDKLPGLMAILLLDMIVAKLQVSLDETFSNPTVSISP